MAVSRRRARAARAADGPARPADDEVDGVGLDCAEPARGTTAVVGPSPLRRDPRVGRGRRRSGNTDSARWPGGQATRSQPSGLVGTGTTSEATCSGCPSWPNRRTSSTRWPAASFADTLLTGSPVESQREDGNHCPCRLARRTPAQPATRLRLPPGRCTDHGPYSATAW